MFVPDLSPLWISLKVSLVATVITFGLGTIVAYRMYYYRGKARSLIEGFLIAPLILPPTVVGFLLLLLLGKNGFLGQFLASWQLRVVFTWYAAVLAAIVVSFPLMYRAALGAFEQIDPLLLDAARLEGASEVAVFWYVALPLAMRGIIAGTILTFARALGEFGATLMLAGNIPGQTQTMPMAIYFAVEAGAIPEAGFWTTIALAIALGGIIAVNYRHD
jgi:molybdate transport system permease protein